MKNERIVSIGTNSMIYHKPGCRYVERIKYKNRISLPKQDAKEEGYLDYIYEHDKYKATIARGEKVTKFSSKKYKRIEAKAERKRQRNRVDYLFRMLERENTGYKELSYC